VEHHLHGRDVPKWKEAWNVAWICATCHDLVHLGEIIIEGWFIIGSRTLVWRHKDEPPKLNDGIVPPSYGK